MIKWLKRLRETYYGSSNEQPTKYGFNVGDTLIATVYLDDGTREDNVTFVWDGEVWQRQKNKQGTNNDL